MKDIDFINESLEFGFKIVVDGETVDITDKIRACDHQLELTSGMPRDILGCPKCGWWSFAPGSLPVSSMERYSITDKRK